MEIWKTITDFEDYKISNLGNVISLERISFSGKKLKQRFINGGIDSRGYHMINLVSNGVRKTLLVHRLVAKEFIINKDSKPQVNHIDGDKLNNKVYNLEWCTGKENVIHAYKNNLCSDKKGIGNGRAMLSEKDVLEIRDIKNKRISKISIEYNVSWGCISDIIKRKTWVHI